MPGSDGFAKDMVSQTLPQVHTRVLNQVYDRSTVFGRSSRRFIERRSGGSHVVSKTEMDVGSSSTHASLHAPYS